jgi:hypothetical protein
MNKIKEHIFELAMLAVLIRSFIAGASISDALVLITLVLSIVYTKSYLNRKKLDIEAEVLADIKAVKEQLNMIKLDKGIRKVGLNGGEVNQNLISPIRF